MEQQRVSALRFADPQIQALWSALLLFPLLPSGFSSYDLRQHWAAWLEPSPAQLTPGRMTYNLRRLRLHGLIQRLPHTHRYRLTQFGLRTALFFTRAYSRIFRPGMARILPQQSTDDCALRRCFDQLDREIGAWVDRAKLAG